MSAVPGLVCWQCGASLDHLSLPLSRFDECRQCHAALHVCRLCEFHDTTVAKQCREPIAEEVRDKERANVCDYFRPRPGAWSDRTQAASAAKAALESLFSGPGPAAGSTTEQPATDAERARAELEKLFGKC